MTVYWERGILEKVTSEIANRVGRVDPPRRVFDLILEVVTERIILDCRPSEECSEEIAEDLEPAVIERLSELQLVQEKQIPTYEIFGSGSEYIRGASYPDPTLADDVNRVRARRLNIDQVHQELRQLNWREFEVACGKVLEMLGCRDPVVSDRSGDGGIDFYGLLQLRNRLDNLSPLGGFDHELQLWLVGQAKHYEGKVGPDVIRELVGSVELARTRGTSQVWQGLELRAFDPVVLLVFTTGEFSEGAMTLLEDSGVLFMDGFQFAMFLTDNGIGIGDLESFDKDDFRSALLEQ